MAKLTVEEWEKLTPKEQADRAQEKPDNYTPSSGVKEDVVIINGQSRPLKNYEAEMRRKFDEDKAQMEAEYQEKLRSSIVNQQPAQTNWLEQVYDMAENEIATTGKTVPMQTIMQIANTLSRNNVETIFKTERQAKTAVNNFKRTVHSEPDWSEVESRFDEYVDQLTPDRINAPTLQVIFNAVRGEKLKNAVAKAEAKGKEEGIKETEVLIGNPTTFGYGSRKSAKSSLTPEQQKELLSYNSDNNMEWTEEEYTSSLKKKQDHFKLIGAKNIPQLLSDSLIK